MSLLKKFSVFSLVITTVLWSVGASFAPVKAAGNYDAGSLLALEDTTDAAVYYIGSDGAKYVFPDSKTYFTWYENFDNVVRVDVAELDLYENGGTVTYRAGTKLVTTPDTANVYALEPGGFLRLIPDADTAAAVYGDGWGAMIQDVIPGYFLSSYTTGSDLDTTFPTGTLVQLGEDVYYVDGSTTRLFTGADEFEANNFDWDNVIVVEDLDDYTDGETITGEETDLSGYMPSEGGDDGDEPAATEGAVTVALASDTPAASYTYKNATHVPFTKINFTAGSEAVTIDSLVVERTGAPATDAAFTGVNILNGDELLSSSYKSFNSSHQATFTDDVEVPANSTVSLMLVGKIADVATYAGETPTLSLVTVNTDADVSSNLPIVGNAMTLNGTVNVADVTVTENPDLGTLTEEVGTEDVEFLNVKLANDASEADVRIDSIRFNNAGSADDSDIDNVELVVDNNVIATSEMLNNYIYFDLSDCGDVCLIEDGNNETFQLRGDITGGSGRTLDFDIKKVDDIFAYDTLNSSYVTPDAEIDSGRIVTISRGQLNVSKTNTIQAGNVSEDTNDLELGSWNFKVQGESMTIDTILFDIDVTGTVQAADFTSLKLVDADGNSLTGATDGSGTGDGTVSFTDSFTLPIGDNEIKIVGNLNSDPANSDTVQFAVDFSTVSTSNLDATGDITGDAITIASYAFPQAEVDANLITITDASLSVTTLPNPAAQTIAAGITDHLYSKVRFDATDSSESIKVTAFEFYITASATAKTNEIQNITFLVDGEELSVTKDGGDSDVGDDEEISVSLSGDDQFVVTAGTAVNMDIYADLSAGATAAGTHTIDITSTNSNVITAQGDISGNSVTPTYSSATANAMTVGTAGGTVEVSLAADTPNSALMAGGTEVELAKFKFYATSTENIELDYLYLTQVVTDTNSSSYVDYSEIWFEDEAGVEITGTRMTPTSTKPYINFAADAFVVDYTDVDGEVLTLVADLSPIGTGQNGTSDHYLGYKINAAADVVAKGDLTGSGSTEYLSSGSAPTGKTHYVYKAYPTFERVALNSSTLGNGTVDLFKFTVSAVNGDIGLYGLTFDVATTGCTATDLYLYNQTDGDLVLNDTAGTAPLGVWQTIGTNWTTNYSSSEVIVASGTTETFYLQGLIAGASSGDSISVKLAGDSAHVAGTDTLMHTAAEVDTDSNDDFIWSDRNAGSHGTGTDDWTNGYLISGLPSASSTAQGLSL